jgi:hypothetical protein
MLKAIKVGAVALCVVVGVTSCGRKAANLEKKGAATPPAQARTWIVSKVGDAKVTQKKAKSLDKKSDVVVLEFTTGKGENNFVGISPATWKEVKLSEIDRVTYTFELPQKMAYDKVGPYLRVRVDLEGDGDIKKDETLVVEPAYLNDKDAVVVRDDQNKPHEIVIAKVPALPINEHIGVLVNQKSTRAAYSLNKDSKAIKGADDGKAVVANMLSFEQISNAHPKAIVRNITLVIGSNRDRKLADHKAIIRNFEVDVKSNEKTEHIVVFKEAN